MTDLYANEESFGGECNDWGYEMTMKLTGDNGDKKEGEAFAGISCSEENIADPSKGVPFDKGRKRMAKPRFSFLYREYFAEKGLFQ